MKYLLLNNLFIGLILVTSASVKPVKATDYYNIKSISFQGLDKTKPRYLKRFIKTEVGSKLDSNKLENDAQYLSNIPFIYNAKFQVTVNSKSHVKVIFKCEEQHTLLPILNFGGLPENLWFKVGGSEVNFLGRGMKVSGFYQYYDRNSFQLSVGHPFLGGSPWGANMRLTKWSTTEPLFFKGQNAKEQEVTYHYDNYNLELTGNYKFSTSSRPFSDKLTVGGVLFREQYEKTQESIEASAPGPREVYKDKFMGKLIYNKNLLDYDFFYVRGVHNSLHVQSVFTQGAEDRFDLFFNDFKYFTKLGKQGNWANRWRLGLSTNRESPFAPFVLDNSINIRGVGNRIDRGTGTVIYNTEYRQTLYENDFGAIQGVGFADLGTWRKPGGNFRDFVEEENFRFYGGGGIRLIYKPVFDAILRIDYSINLQQPSKGGFVIGLGQYI